MDGHPSFGRWLQQRRKALDLTQDELSQCVGCVTDTIRKIEADLRRPSKALVERLAECLAIEADDQQAFLYFARGESSTVLPAPLPQPAEVHVGRQLLRVRGTLPAPITALIGREREVAAVCALLCRADVRLLTLSG